METKIKEQCQDKTKYLDQIIDYVFKELQWYEDVEKDLNTFQIGCDYRIAYSDGAVNETLKRVSQLELKISGIIWK